MKPRWRRQHRRYRYQNPGRGRFPYKGRIYDAGEIIAAANAVSDWVADLFDPLGTYPTIHEMFRELAKALRAGKEAP